MEDAAELAAAVAAAGTTPLIVEQVVPFDRELSVIGARSPGGEFRAYGPFENSHRRHILDLTSSPRRDRRNAAAATRASWSATSWSNST